MGIYGTNSRRARNSCGATGGTQMRRAEVPRDREFRDAPRCAATRPDTGPSAPSYARLRLRSATKGAAMISAARYGASTPDFVSLAAPAAAGRPASA